MERLGNFLLVPGALLMDTTPELNEWEDMADYLFRYQRWLYWMIGDFIIYGENAMGDDIYQCFEPGMSLSLMQRCAAVSRSFELDERYPELSWTQHQLVSKYPKPFREAVLQRSLAEGWDTGQLRDYLDSLKD
jgi:hypothetical protein